MPPSPRRALLVVPLCLAVVAGCGGGKSDAEKAKEGAAQALAACKVFVNFRPPSGTDTQSKIDYAKASYGAFIESAELAGKAADLDPRWQRLKSAAEREAAGFQVISRAATGSDTVDVAAVNRAVAETKAARPIFIAECAKADPKDFSSLSPSPSASPDTSGKKA
ncbi:MAG TPA: hypothetical protein VHE57_10175 [Mycobacteriales bacterium]|nr:hypothetical protein [Mycobacteriales bacterium]